uniref:S8 family peptidase n=1 Tax=uncultured Erythrobacter sp. TaxID=263913 RepID=UPI0026364652|nr:S8 family peptidase [uncultured Erythrobacter sp.]
MKSLSFSTATAAVAISLASSAHAKGAAPIALPELDESAATFEVVDALEVPAITLDLNTDASTLATFSAPTENSLPTDLLPMQPITGLITLPATSIAQTATFFEGGAVTTRSLTSNSIDPRYGDIDAFYGDIVAFYGDIDAFWGDISPFYGDIDAFYGDIDAFWGDISPFYGDITAFWGDIDAFWGDIVAFDQGNLQAIGQFGQNYTAQISAVEERFNSISYYSDGSIVRDGTPDQMMAQLSTLISLSEAQFGAKYTAETGKSFDELVSEVFARHGAQAYNKASIEVLSKGQRARLYLDFHDTLMQYSGVDHVDHWMGTVNWTPSITQIQGSGSQTLIGVIDSNFGSNGDLTDNLVWSSGTETTLNGHGAGVASLIAGAHDGQGVMGIAPNANIAAYNPFDSDGQATWDGVAAGIWAIKGQALWNSHIGDYQRASVINLSLGESGWVASQGLADMFGRSDISTLSDSTVYVIAAGNDGIAQTSDIEWSFSTTQYSTNDPTMDPALALMLGYPVYATEAPSDTAAIFVGSVRPDGSISDFSNRPGDACLLDNGVCYSGNELMNRFIVAPGELLLVDNGNGGLARRSGTSFAAPLVSGAIALLHDRWPWLADQPHETADIIFRSAKDLGAPGVDAVYGHGLLDVTASQAPLDFGAMTFTLYQKKGKNYRASTMSASSLLNSGIPSWWESNDVYFTAFEDIGDTYRDFAIPMSSFTYGKRTTSLGNGYQRLQDFVSDRFANWLLSGGTDKDGNGRLGVSQVRSNLTETQGQWSMRFDAIAPQFSDDGAMRPIHNAATLSNPAGNMSFTLGHGQGALALAGNNFGIISDHDQDTGGVNPVLGFASGETFAGATYMPSKATTLSVGYSQQREDWRDLDGVSEIERNVQRELGAREAEALTVGVKQQVAKGFTVNAQYTYLREQDAVLGAQTTNSAFLGEGSATNAVTFTASMDIGNGFSFDLSATGGATETAQGQLFATSNEVLSSAGQFTVNKRGVMGDRDVLRVSVGQPLTVERGELEFLSEQVVDRLTGERDVVSQTIGIETKRRYTGEIVYATPVTKTSELGVVGRYISAGELGQDESFMIGANFGLRF